MLIGLAQEQCLVSIRDMHQAPSGPLKIIQREVAQPEVQVTVRRQEDQIVQVLEEQQQVNMLHDITGQRLETITLVIQHREINILK